MFKSHHRIPTLHKCSLSEWELDLKGSSKYIGSLIINAAHLIIQDKAPVLKLLLLEIK